MSDPHSRPGTEQQDRQPGEQHAMRIQPESIRADYLGSAKLEGKVALISGGDSGIGRAVALHFAREGADVVIVYLDEDIDAEDTRRLIEAEGREARAIRADLSKLDEARRAVRQAIEAFGRLDVLVHSIARQEPQAEPEDITPEQLDRTFRNNVYSYFYLTQAALPHLGEGAAIIFTGSVTGSRGSPQLLDYASTKGAIEALNYSLAQSLGRRGIRVNLVAPGPIWTPLIVATFPPEKIESFGKNTLMKRAGQPSEVAPAFVFLASADASYITGQIIHVNGGGFIGS